MKSLALVEFGNPVFTQPLCHIERVRHGHDIRRVDCLHLLDEREDTRKLGLHVLDLGITQGNARKLRDFLHVISGNHGAKS